MSTERERLAHPCKQTCSGWRQGYEEGHDAATKAKDEELENLKKEIHALKIEMFSVAGGREILKAENARLRSEAAEAQEKINKVKAMGNLAYQASSAANDICERQLGAAREEIAALRDENERLRSEAAEARAKAFDECGAEAQRKYDMNERPNKNGIGHSAQSFGQSWAYQNIIDWCKEKTQAARKGEG